MAHLAIHQFNDNVFLELGKALWNWESCDGCSATGCAKATACSSLQPIRAQRYFRFYEAVVLDYKDASHHERNVFKTHGDIFKAIVHLKKNLETTRSDLNSFISSSDHLSTANRNDLLNASALVVRVVAMLDCSTSYQSPDRLEKGLSRVYWEDHVPFRKYLQDLFPKHRNVFFSASDGNDLVLGSHSRLRATKLHKHLKITLRPTPDIRNHLRLDPGGKELDIFHYASFLKEHLRATRNLPTPLSKSTPMEA
jgi:hypothetical protein